MLVFYDACFIDSKMFDVPSEMAWALVGPVHHSVVPNRQLTIIAIFGYSHTYIHTHIYICMYVCMYAYTPAAYGGK